MKALKLGKDLDYFFVIVMVGLMVHGKAGQSEFRFFQKDSPLERI